MDGDQESSWWLSFLLPIAVSIPLAIGYHMLKPSEYDDIIPYAKKVEAEGKTQEKETKQAHSAESEDDDEEKSHRGYSGSFCSGQRTDTMESGHGTDEIVFISVIAFREKYRIMPGEQITDEEKLLELYSLAH